MECMCEPSCCLSPELKWTQDPANESSERPIGAGASVRVEAEWKQVATYQATSVIHAGYWQCSLTSSRPNNLWHICPWGDKEKGPKIISRKCPISLPMMNITRDENRHLEVHQDPRHSWPGAYWNIRGIATHKTPTQMIKLCCNSHLSKAVMF